MAKVTRAERARQQQAEAAKKTKPKESTRDTEFNKKLRESQIVVKPGQMSRAKSKVATEQAIKHVVKEKDKHEEGRKRERDDSDEGRDSRQEGKKSGGKVAKHKVIAKGSLKQGGGGSKGQQGGHGGGGMGSSDRKSSARLLKRSGVKVIPTDLKGKFASKLSQAMQGTSAAEQSALSQQILNKLVQFVRIGINRKGEKEIQIDLNERIFRGLKLRVIARGGKVGVVLSTLDKRGKKVLEKNREGIMKALSDKGIDVEDIEIT